jgi:uncharacterized damage-inducible protein DinB
VRASDIRALFDYNRWANRRLLHAAAALTPAQFTEDRASSFGSVRDTLAHIYAAEAVWLSRWKGISPPGYAEAAEFPSVAALTERWEQLETARRDFLARLLDTDLEEQVTYTNVQGEPWRYPRGQMMLHIVNHSTYHRGQVVTLLRQHGAPVPGTDLLLFLDETTDTKG